MALLLKVRQSKKTVVIGWDVDETVEGLIKGLGDFAPADSSVTIISPEKPEGLLKECGNCRCQHLEGSIASRQVLLEVSVAFGEFAFKHAESTASRRATFLSVKLCKFVQCMLILLSAVFCGHFTASCYMFYYCSGVCLEFNNLGKLGHKGLLHPRSQAPSYKVMGELF